MATQVEDLQDRRVTYTIQPTVFFTLTEWKESNYWHWSKIKNGRVVKERDSDGFWQLFQYDAAGDLVQIVTDVGVVKNGRIVKYHKN